MAGISFAIEPTGLESTLLEIGAITALSASLVLLGIRALRNRR